MKEIEIEVFPANEGDSLLITLIDKDFRILIDGGNRKTYYEFLKDKLLMLAADNREINLLIITHIDDDHIGGIIELLKENGSNEEPRIIKINNIWHNSYRHMQYKKVDSLGNSEREILNAIIANGNAYSKKGEGIVQHQISANQGSTLAALILAGHYSWNKEYNGQAINCDINNCISICEECDLHILSPDTEALEELGYLWESTLKRKKLGFKFSDSEIFDDAFEFFMRFYKEPLKGQKKDICVNNKKIDFDNLLMQKESRDNSKTNLSSISFCLRYKTHNLLYLSDGIANDIINRVKDIKYFDLIKIPHHGSSKNTSADFIQKVNTDKFLISTNGLKHGHPDLSVVAKLIANSNVRPFLVYLNYNIDKLSALDVKELKEKYKYDIVYPSEKKELLITI